MSRIESTRRYMAIQRLSKPDSQLVSNTVNFNMLGDGSSRILVHGGKESKFITILRTFDLTSEYGPCVGVSRLERWERAKDMGLDPPQEVMSSNLLVKFVE